jgi:hypothetical protein
MEVFRGSSFFNIKSKVSNLCLIFPSGKETIAGVYRRLKWVPNYGTQADSGQALLRLCSGVLRIYSGMLTLSSG